MARSVIVGDKALEGQGEYEPIPNGAKLRVSVYDITETKIKNGPNAGQPQAEFTVKVTEEGQFKGRELKYNYLPLFGDANNAWFLVAFAEAVGWDIDKDTKAVSIPDDLREVLGTEFIAKIQQVESQKINPATGKPYINNRVNGARKIKSGGGITDPAEKPAWDKL